jgi:GNAT superfamily N-acetyltransferase
VTVEAGELAGFYGLRGDPPELELTFLFIEPRFIGQGVGRALLLHSLEAAAKRGAERVRVVSDPSAEAFYLAMGAVRDGEEPSGSIPGRSLPTLVFALDRSGPVGDS